MLASVNCLEKIVRDEIVRDRYNFYGVQERERVFQRCECDYKDVCDHIHGEFFDNVITSTSATSGEAVEENMAIGENREARRCQVVSFVDKWREVEANPVPTVPADGKSVR